MLKVGDMAIDFSLPNEKGENITLSNFKGKKIVLYFYPKDNTPGCTTEACTFRDIYQEILDKDAVVIGISPDSITSHQKFKEKYNLPFYLLADEDHTVCEMYGAWGEKRCMVKHIWELKELPM